MSIHKTRSFLYKTAKLLGHLQAFNKAKRKRSAKPIFKRIGRVYTGKVFSRILYRMFR